MKRRLFLIAFCLPLFCSAQTDTLQQFTLTSEQARSDFRLYRRLLQETHPGLYRYTSKDNMQRFLDSVDASFIRPIGFYDYQRLLARVNANIRCAHSSALPGSDFHAYMRSIKILPLFIEPVQGKYVVLLSGTGDASIQPGWELTHINGTPIDNIAAVLKKHCWSDGYNEVAKKYVVQGSTFGLFYYMIIERPDKFRLTFNTRNGEKKEAIVAAQFLGHSEANYKKNPLNKKMMSFYGKGNKSWQLKFPKDVKHTAILNIYGFGGKNQNNGDQARAALKGFMDQAMKDLNKRGVTNLIVDVRGNPGGWDTQGVELFTYLIQTDLPVYYYRRLHAITDSSEFLKYSDLSDEDKRNAKQELRPEADGTYTMREEYNTDLKLQYPKPNRFKGQVYILANYRSASTTSEFIAVCKSNKVGLIVGEESGGCYEGGNGASFITMTLPHSKISVNTPLIYYQNAVIPVTRAGRGTIPDYAVPQTVDDLLTGRDTMLEWVKERIRKGEL